MAVLQMACPYCRAALPATPAGAVVQCGRCGHRCRLPGAAPTLPEGRPGRPASPKANPNAMAAPRPSPAAARGTPVGHPAGPPAMPLSRALGKVPPRLTPAANPRLPRVETPTSRPAGGILIGVVLAALVGAGGLGLYLSQPEDADDQVAQASPASGPARKESPAPAPKAGKPQKPVAPKTAPTRPKEDPPPRRTPKTAPAKPKPDTPPRTIRTRPKPDIPPKPRPEPPPVVVKKKPVNVKRPVVRTTPPKEKPASEQTASDRIDALVFGKLKEKGITPAPVCPDGVFLRRVYLDVIGTLPTSEEASAFLVDYKRNKRQLLIDRLLERPEFADYWAMKWGDLLRIKSEFPINLWPNAVQAYHRWVRTALQKNMPYDQFARQLLTSSGSNFRVPPVNFYRAVQSREPTALAQAVGLTFMGVRPEGLTKDQWARLAPFFARVAYKGTGEWKEEIVYFDPRKAVPEGLSPAAFPDGTAARIGPDQDPREVFANWLLAPENPWFARNIANRAWSWMLGRGIIDEPDDIRPDNRPSNPELLAFLEKELVRGRYDLKHLFRVILNSKAYQLSSIPASDNPAAEAHFAHYTIRRLEAEVLIDAICRITGTTESYSSPIPEPFTFIPEDQRSIALPDASITSSFLEMFGRPPRDTGLESERNNRATPNQMLHLLNSSHIQRKIEQGPGLRDMVGGGVKPEVFVDELYLRILSRFPTEEEARVAHVYARNGSTSWRAAKDLAWALITSPEFLYRH